MRKKHPFEADQVQKVMVRVATSEASTREQSRNARHLPAAHGGGDADRQDRVVRAAHDKPRMQDAAVLSSAPKCS